MISLRVGARRVFGVHRISMPWCRWSSTIQLSISQVEPHGFLFRRLIRLHTLAVLSQLADIPFLVWFYQWLLFMNLNSICSCKILVDLYTSDIGSLGDLCGEDVQVPNAGTSGR